jgi:uncharacterized protein with von Willebrand factor type A (vWA) domain
VENRKKSTGTLSDRSGIFLEFFYRLKNHKIPVTITEWLALVEGMVLGLHGSSLIGFYSLARSVLVKDEAYFDEFDRVFADYFKGLEDITVIEKDIYDWLNSPIQPYQIDPELRKVLDNVDVERLRELFEERLKEQQEKHDGGNRWIGTGGTSPFGHSGYHPGGIRVGGQGRFGSAVQIAAARRFREHRQDLVLDTRQLTVALRKLRSLKRQGNACELDIDGTIDETAKQAGELELVFRPPRSNNMSLLLAVDVGGSMEPYRKLVDILFSAAYAARHFKRFEHVYFHNCIYGEVYEDAHFHDRIPTPELLTKYDRETRLVILGDAYMYPGELTDRYGAVYWDDRNVTPGIEWLRRLDEHFKHVAWINPMSERMWHAPSVRLIRQIYNMLPLTVEGVELLAQELS